MRHVSCSFFFSIQDTQSSTLTKPMSTKKSGPTASLYTDAAPWAEAKTMEHASGIWGRKPALGYLKTTVVHPGDTVVDLGCGAGYPSLQIIGMVGDNGQVIGIEQSDAMLDAASKYKDVRNLSFTKGDITQQLPVPAASADVVTSFMVCHNLRQDEMRAMFEQTFRALKAGGHSVILTMHPEALNSNPAWDLDFSVYDSAALERYRLAANDMEREDMEIPGIVKNVSGESKRVTMFYHSRSSALGAAYDCGLTLRCEESLHINGTEAVEKFGHDAVRVLPKTPTFWLLHLEKPNRIPVLKQKS